MSSPYSYYRQENKRPKLKEIISTIIQNRNNSSKLHSDCLNCFINCANYKFTLQIIQEPKKGKNNLYFVQEEQNFNSPLLFYEQSSNEIIEIIEKKNILENYLNDSHKIKSENEIIPKYEQNKKNKILLFSYLKFPLININSENNNNNKSTIIILDEGKYENISNFSNNSYSVFNKNYSLLFDIHNLKNAKYLFSINDIKDSKLIKFKFNGNAHGQKLFTNDAICTIPRQLIINSIKNRMKDCINLKNKEIIKNLSTKLFFTQLKDDSRNNIGILFSFGKIKDINETNFNEEYIMKENFKIIKIFLGIDLWTGTNNTYETKDTSDSSSIKTNQSQPYFKDNNDFCYNNNGKNKYTNKFETYNECTIKNNINDNNYNNYGIYEHDYHDIGSENNEFYKDFKYTNNHYYPSYKKESTNENYYKENTNLNLIKNDNFKTTYENPEFLENSTLEEYYELNNLLNNINSINSDKNYTFPVYTIKNEIIKEVKSENTNENIKKSKFLDTNNEFIKEIFSKFKDNNCISNYDIMKKYIDINMNIEKEKIKNVKLKYFFDCFKDINHLSINLPYLNKKGKLSFEEINPTLSSMRIVLKTRKKKAKNIMKNKKENYKIKLIKSNILKIEYEEIRPPYERELLYIKLEEIKQILGDNKLIFKNVLLDKSYFSILWTFSNTFKFNNSFLAYYSFDLKLIGVLILNFNEEEWFSSFSSVLNYYKEYKKEYDNNVENIKNFFKNLAIDKEEGYYQNFLSSDYMHYIRRNNIYN